MTIHRASGSATFPCRAQLVLAANPCPCASAAGDTACTCSPLERRRYQSRLSGPLLDRIDLRVDLPPVTRAAWLDGLGAAGADARSWPAGCWPRGRPRRDRLAGTGLTVNSQVPGRLLRERWAVPRAVAAAGRAGAGARRAVGARLRPGAAGRVDARRPGRPRRSRAPTRWPRRSACGCSGWRHDARRGPRGRRGCAACRARCTRRCGGRGPGSAGPCEPGTVDFWRYVDDVGPVDGGPAAARRARARADPVAGRRAGRSRTRASPTSRGPSAAAPGWSCPRTTSGRPCRCTP